MTRAEMRANIAHVIPEKLRRLPVDARGYPVPYFVAWVDGKPDHRITDPQRWRLCVTTRRCWICGTRLGKFAAFVVGPMCLVNMASGEPPSHPDCAKFAVKACPFLTLPRAQRRDAKLPTNVTVHPDMLAHNPGAMALWVTDEWGVMPSTSVNGAYPLITFGEPSRVSFWCEGRQATRGEVLDAFAKGLPELKQRAQQEGGNALERLSRCVDAAMFWIPETT